jgi:hypothetical protein
LLAFISLEYFLRLVFEPELVELDELEVFPHGINLGSFQLLAKNEENHEVFLVVELLKIEIDDVRIKRDQFHELGIQIVHLNG